MRTMNKSKQSYRELTKAEEQVMQILWEKQPALVHDILREFDEPRPAYNTVSTIIRILEQKGFVGHKAYGRTHEYFTLISKKDYSSTHFSHFLKNYFGNSFQSLASSFASEKKLSIRELEEIQKAIHEEIKKQKEELR